MSATVPAGRARAQVAWILLLLTCAALSILWWRADLAACTCDACPDGHCGYAERIHLALTGSLPWTNLHRFARWYMHAQIPLSASLVAIAMFAVPSSAQTFAVNRGIPPIGSQPRDGKLAADIGKKTGQLAGIPLPLAIGEKSPL